MGSIRADELKDRVSTAIDDRREDIADLTETVLRNAELGYREFKTSSIVQEIYDQLGIEYQTGLAITGIKADVPGGAGPGPRVAVIGELDALPIPDHPDANPETGAAHACGHNAQTAMAVAVAMGLVDSGVMEELAGSVALFNVPAEELIDLEYRQQLKDEGKIEFFVGKPELIRLGAFDDIDMSMMIHNTGTPPDLQLGVGTTLNGCLMKTITYRGQSSHAGATPWGGVNALNAANVAFNAIHAQRETFHDDDAVRVHWIITKGGSAVNVVPAEVRIEMFVRARTADALVDANQKTDRALRAGAVAIGAEVEIETVPGYMPILPYREFDAVFRDNAERLVGEDGVTAMPHKGGSTDMGDVSHIMPAIHPFTGGAKGNAHTTGWHAGSVDDAVLRPAKAMAMTIIDLLYGDAGAAKCIIEQSKPPMTKEEYLAFVRNQTGVEQFGAE